jgi:hypothetical protein
MTALLVDTSTPTGAPAVTRRRGRGLWAAIRSSRKAQVGFVLLLVFCIVAAVPWLFTSVHDPNALQFPPRLPPSSEHWLGTTSLGQDIWAQLVYGTRQSLVIAVVAGLFATVLSVLVGVTAAYLGGVPDDVLSMIIMSSAIHVPAHLPPAPARARSVGVPSPSSRWAAAFEQPVGRMLSPPIANSLERPGSRTQNWYIISQPRRFRRYPPDRVATLGAASMVLCAGLQLLGSAVNSSSRGRCWVGRGRVS